MRYDSAIGNGGAEEMNAEILRINTSGGSGAPKTFLVTIPPNVFPGMHFTVTAEGQKFKVTCPPNAGPGKKVRIVAPNTGRGQDLKPPEEPETKSDPKMQVYEVIVPQGVRPNQPFTLMANNQRVLVTCPPNVSAGQKIRFQLPVPVAKPKGKINICLSYKDESGSSGWERTVRVTDHKFQWIRVSEQEDDDCKKKSSIDDFVTSSSRGARALEDMTSFDFKKAAYVRKIQYLEGNDARMRTGIVSLVPANEAVVHSDYTDKDYHGTNISKKLFDYNDIAQIQCKSMDEKVEWFHESVCEELYTPWEKGHVKIVVRRHSLLEDSVSAIMSLGRNDMRKRWRIEFAGEPGIEAGGLTREWFQLVTEQIFDPDFGLWLSSCNNQMSMQINPASHISCPDDYLRFFRFLGRVMGRALFDRQLIKGHMVRHLYKHLLGWPITFDDLEAQDEEYYSAIKKITAMDDPSIMCLDFTVTEENLGDRKDIPLIPGGETMELTSENLPEYLEANLKYRMLNRCKPQITELILGFFDIIPEPALTIFDPNELELILCGLPTIDMNDWMDNTKYSGYFESKGKRHQVVAWFWEVVQNDFDQEMKARLLQFVTGTSGVPPRGFAVLQGNDGNIKRFCVHGVSRDQYVYPRAHTCFNRIDLPNYSSKRELKEKLGQAVSMTYVGFDIE
jgi:E3 ubiquitin-protein ligase NEDD4